jgi:DNA-binding transcriptional regulator YhcF (GntR family)
MAADPQLVARIRNRIVGEMHLGHLRAGSRLPSVRELARELSVDHRAVAASYRALETEGLVEMRGRPGVYVAQQERLGGELVGETAAWLAGVLGEARRRRISLSDFPDFVRSCTGRVRLRCACVESNADASTSICLEIEEEFGLEAVEVDAGSLLPALAGEPLDPALLPDQLRSADLIVTTAFHAADVRRAAEALDTPFALVTMPEEMSRIIERHVESHGLTVIVSDPEYGRRFCSVFGGGRPESIRTVLADERPVIARLARSEPVLATRAARHRLPDLDLPLLLPRFPSISPESTQEIVKILIRLNMEAAVPPA